VIFLWDVKNTRTGDGIVKNKFRVICFLVFLCILFYPLDQVFANNESATANVIIINGPSIVINPTTGVGGTLATITGSGFSPHVQINLYIDHSKTGNPIHIGTITTDTHGGFTTIVTIPDVIYPGIATISAKHNSVTLASGSFTVPFPTIVLNPTSGSGGTKVTITGSGFGINEQIRIFIGHSMTGNLMRIGADTTNANGEFSSIVTIPVNISADDYIVSARENVNHAVYAANQFTVIPAATTTIIASSHNPSIFGQSITFTSLVSPVAPSGGKPTGSVAFIIDGISQQSVPLSSNGRADFVPSTALSVGSHTVKTQYSGDSNFVTSTSTTLVQTVTISQTKATLVSSINPSTIGQSVTFTATISPVAPGSGTPTGTVTFIIDGVSQPTLSLTGNQAILSTSSLSKGSHSITAQYSGNSSFSSSTSSAYTQKVR
jgi:hypothetical protein